MTRRRRAPRRHGRGRRQDAQRGADPAEVLDREARALAAGRAPEEAADAAERRVAALRRSDRRHPGVPSRHLPVGGRPRSALRARASKPMSRSGSSAAAAGQSADVAGANGLRFAANYHVSPATILEAVEGYRAAFRPSPELEKPYIAVSADVVVAEDEDRAHDLAVGYGAWVLSIRDSSGAHPVSDPGGGSGARLVRRGAGDGGRSDRDPVRRDRRAGRRSAASGWRMPPTLTSWSSRPSPTTTPTGFVPTSCSPRSGPAGQPRSAGPAAARITRRCRPDNTSEDSATGAPSPPASPCSPPERQPRRGGQLGRCLARTSPDRIPADDGGRASRHRRG